MSNFRFELGSFVEDQISKFSGVVVGRSDYLTGCNAYLVNPQKLTSEGSKVDSLWFDEMNLRLLKKKKLEFENPKLGGEPIKPSSPSR